MELKLHILKNDTGAYVISITANDVTVDMLTVTFTSILAALIYIGGIKDTYKNQGMEIELDENSVFTYLDMVKDTIRTTADLVKKAIALN